VKKKEERTPRECLTQVKVKSGQEQEEIWEREQRTKARVPLCCLA
jgi:hypothetical protein